MNNDLILQSKNNIPFIEAQVEIHQPTISEISLINEENFQHGCRFLSFSKDLISEEDKSNLGEKSDFEILMAIINDKDAIKVRNSVLFVLTLLFPDYTIKIEKDFIKLEKEDFSTLITRSNYDAFKDIIVSMFDIEETESIGEYNPVDKMAAKIAKKIQDAKNKREKLKSGGATSDKIAIFSRYISILAVGEGKDKNVLMEYTVSQLKDEFKRFQMRENWNYYIEAKKAGAKDLEEVDNWMKEIHP